MRPSGHLHSTTIALAIIYQFIPSFSILEGVLFFSGVMLLDGDFIVSRKLFHIQNHRLFITHSILLYIILIILSFSTHVILFWLFLGAFYHLCFDVFDWGIPLIPFQTETYFTPHLLQVPPQLDEIYFFKTYFSNKTINLLESVLLVGCIGSLFFLPIPLMVLVVLVEVLVIAEFLFHYRNLQLMLNK